MQRKSHIPFLLAALAIASAAWAGAAPELEPKVAAAVRISIPKGWTARSEAGRILLAALPPAPDQDSTGKFQASLTITQDAGTKVDAAAQQNLLARQMSEYKVIEKPATITASGLEGFTFGGTFKSDKVELRSRQYLFLVNNQLYTLTFTCLASKWPVYEPLLNASIATFTVKQK